MEPLLARGTTTMCSACDDGIAMAADRLMHVERNGEAVPLQGLVRKVFVLEPNILIGTWGVARCAQIEYKVEDWISAFILSQGGATAKLPNEVAENLQVKVRDTFHVLESNREHSLWRANKPGDRVVSYFVAGYTKKFERPYLFEVGLKINQEGTGFWYEPLESKDPKRGNFGGEEIAWRMAKRGQEPYASRLNDILYELRANPPQLPANLAEIVLSMVSLIKVEAEFNGKKVGSDVAVAVIERESRRQSILTF